MYLEDIRTSNILNSEFNNGYAYIRGGGISFIDNFIINLNNNTFKKNKVNYDKVLEIK